MGTTVLRKVRRGWLGEALYRLNWMFFGGVAAVALAFIPIIGWVASVGVVGAILWKVCGFREVLTEGDCPACTGGLHIDPKKDDVISCPICHSVMRVEPDRLVLIDMTR